MRKRNTSRLEDNSLAGESWLIFILNAIYFGFSNYLRWRKVCMSYSEEHGEEDNSVGGEEVQAVGGEEGQGVGGEERLGVSAE